MFEIKPAKLCFVHATHHSTLVGGQGGYRVGGKLKRLMT